MPLTARRCLLAPLTMSHTPLLYSASGSEVGPDVLYNAASSAGINQNSGGACDDSAGGFVKPHLRSVAHIPGHISLRNNPEHSIDSGRCRCPCPIMQRRWPCRVLCPPELPATRIGYINATQIDPTLYADNAIRTSKYTWYNFLPKGLLAQFARLANCFFLVIGLLMAVGTYTNLFQSPLLPFSTLGPLALVLSISLIKEAQEDIKRHRADAAVNARTAHILEPNGAGNLLTPTWRNVALGSIIRLRGGDEVPADLVVLHSSEPNGAAYVETSNIDGEQDLKLKSAVPGLAAACPTPSSLADITGTFECDQPNDSLYVFNGALHLSNHGDFGVSNRNVLLRGSVVRNTKELWALVVYTGKDTKVMKKSSVGRVKLSQVERTINRLLLLIFTLQVILCTVATVSSLVWSSVNDSNTGYLLLATSTELLPDWLARWLATLILFNNFIPISLYVTVEMVNYVQAYLIGQDAAMYDPESDTAALARTSNINQDLGQIEFIFSDKTGTLTCNLMEFRMFSAGGKVWGSMPGVDLGYAVQEHEQRQPEHNYAGLYDPRLAGVLGNGRSSEDAKSVQDVLMALALCHTVIPEEDSTAPGGVRYQCESPDEGALVQAASAAGFSFVSRTTDSLTVLARGVSTTVQLLGVHEFNADRKRMSVVVRHADGRAQLLCKGADNIMFERIDAGAIQRSQTSAHLAGFASAGLRTLVVAARDMSGAELQAWQEQYNSAQKLAMGREDALAALAERTETHMTLLGTTAIEDRLQEGVPDAIAAMSKAGIKLWVLTGDKVETAVNIGRSCKLLDEDIPDRNLIYLTSSQRHEVHAKLDELASKFQALHDAPAGALQRILHKRSKRLARQDVRGKKAAARARAASVVTGNAAAAARQRHGTLDSAPPTPTGSVGTPMCSPGVASSSGMDESPAWEGRNRVDTFLMDSMRVVGAPVGGAANPMALADSATKSGNAVQLNMAVVITGAALAHILGHPAKERQLLAVSTLCRSVVACRVSPSQKANVVAMVQRGILPRPLTLSIGDGANDVGMIQRADVGVGISGREGLQAVNASDFAIAQFRFLQRLLLVHGRFSYIRLSKVVLYSFYKNAVLAVVLFVGNALAGFSGLSLFESLVYSGYNFFLGMPIIMVGIFDKDVSQRAVMNHPMLYATGLYHMELNMSVMLRWLFESIVYGVLVCAAVWGPFVGSLGIWNEDGQVFGLVSVGHTAYTCLIVAMNIKVAMPAVTSTWTAWNHLFLWASLAGYLLFIAAYSMVWLDSELYGVVAHMFGSATHWMCVVLTAGSVVAFELCMSLCTRRTFIDDFAELERTEGYDHAVSVMFPHDAVHTPATAATGSELGGSTPKKHGAAPSGAAAAAGTTGTAMGSPSFAHGPGGVPTLQPSVLHNASWPSANSPTTMAQRRGAGSHDSSSGASGATAAVRHRQARANSELPPVSSPLHPGLELPAKSHGAGPQRAHHAKNGQLVTMSSPLHTVTNEGAPPVSPLLIGGQKPFRASSSPDFLTDYRSTGLRKPGRPSTTAKSPAMTIAASPLTMTRPTTSHT